MDHHAHTTAPEPVRRGRVVVVDAVDDLQLEEVVARSEAADLADTPLSGPFADAVDVDVGVGVGDEPTILTVLEVALDAVASLHRVAGSAA